MAKKRGTLNISQEAKSELDSVKFLGQSYDGIIRELIGFWRDKTGVLTRRQTMVGFWMDKKRVLTRRQAQRK